jgi:hypothetical protein
MGWLWNRLSADERAKRKRIKELKSLIKITQEVGNKCYPDDPTTQTSIAYIEEEIRRLEKGEQGHQ